MSDLSHRCHWYDDWVGVQIATLAVKEGSNELTSEALEFLQERAGPRGIGWQYPSEGLVVIKEPRVAMLFKLTWGGD